eukprot:1348780-Amphidinium_carterae.1
MERKYAGQIRVRVQRQRTNNINRDSERGGAWLSTPEVWKISKALIYASFVDSGGMPMHTVHQVVFPIWRGGPMEWLLGVPGRAFDAIPILAAFRPPRISMTDDELYGVQYKLAFSPTHIPLHFE